MGTAAPTIILLDGVTGTVTGPVQGLQGDAVAYTKQLYEIPIHVNVNLKGAAPTSCTIIVETCDTLAGSYVTWATFALTAAAHAMEFTGVLKVRYIRARVSASSGTNVIDAYLRLRG